MIRQILNQEKGSSLVQVMIAAGLTGVVMTAMTSMFMTQNKQSSHLQNKADAINVQTLLNSAMMSDEFCSCNFGSVILGSEKKMKLSALKLGCSDPNSEMLNTDKPVSQGSQLIVENIQLENVRNVNAGVDYYMDLVISFKNSLLGNPVKPVRVSFFGSVKPGTLKVQSCRPQATAVIRDMCQSMGGNYNPINGRCSMPPPQVIVQQVMIPVAYGSQAPQSSNPTMQGSSVAASAASAAGAGANCAPIIISADPSPRSPSTVTKTVTQTNEQDPCATASGIDAVYCQKLGRMPDEAGKAWWLEQVSSGRITMSQAEAGIANSSEAAILNAAKAAGLNIRSVNEISGQVDTNVMEIDRASAENGVSRAQIVEYTKGTLTNDPNVKAVNDLYQDIAGRQADAAGAAWWLQQIQAGNATLDDLKKGLQGEVAGRKN